MSAKSSILTHYEHLVPSSASYYLVDEQQREGRHHASILAAAIERRGKGAGAHWLVGAVVRS
jgi:hypothetical protein